MQDELYADSIGEITVSGTIVRIDLVSLSHSGRDASGAPRPVFRQRIIMSVDGFANSVDLMQKALQSLIDGGAIRRVPVGEDVIAAGHDMGATHQRPSTAGQNGSPNFS